MRAKWWALAAVALAPILMAAPAQAAWTVSVSGLWNTNAPVTAYSVPLEPFAFSFQFPAQTFSTIYQDANISVTTQMTNVHYSLDGVALPVTLWTGPQAGCSGLAVGTLCNIAFFDTSLMGGIALAFSDHVLEFYGADFGSTGTLVPGVYPLIPNVDDTLVDEGTALATVGVPEPGAWAMILLGIGGVGAAVRAAAGRKTARRPAAA